jgi:uncharacterized membrane protein
VLSLAAALIFAVGGVICHQLPERSFSWNGHQFPICARCTGMYASAAVGLLGWLMFKSARAWRRSVIDPRIALRLIAVAAVPTALSVATGIVGVWDGSNTTRAVLAIPLGASAGAIVAAVFTKDLR